MTGRPYAEVIGDPISHSKSPLIHNFWLEKLGIDAEYRACHVKPDDLPDYFASRRKDPDWRGCNVTIPHKQAVIASIDRLSDAAERVGAVNTVWRDSDGRLHGTNTDVDGIAEATGRSAVGKIVVIGAGGAARAAFALLATMPEADATVLARSPEKAERACSECGLFARTLTFAAGSGAFEGACLVINATQLGMTGQEAMPRFVLDEIEGMTPDGLVFDMVYAPLETELLRHARQNGLAVSDGLVMLVGQAATAFEKFFGQSPPRDLDDELRRILTS
ncbi:MAG: shikimate dehydrogenase [Novosphingobium sp.]|nr:shikimate dehydrogenase [Novosphingobium sp.]